MTMKRRSGIKFLTLLLTIAGCTSMCETSHEDMSPEQVVEAYLTEAFNIQYVNEIDNIIQYTTDNLKRELERANQQQINEMFIRLHWQKQHHIL